METSNRVLRSLLATAAAAALVLAGCSAGSSTAPGSIPASSTAAVSKPTTVPATPTPTAAPTPAPTLADFFSRCPTAQEVADVNSRLKITFEGSLNSTLVCTAESGSADLNDIQKKAYQTIISLKYIQFSKPLPWTDKQLYDWLTVASGIVGIRFAYAKDDPNNQLLSFCCSPAHTLVIYYRETNFLVTTKTWTNARMGIGLSNIASLLLHEARHNLFGPHTCGRNDKTLAEMGPVAVEYYFFKWIESYSDRAFFQAPGVDPDMYLYSAQYEATRIRAGYFCNEPPVDLTKYEPQPLPPQ